MAADDDGLRYCPMCNRRTACAVEQVDPFRVETCQACGHVHAIVERPRRASGMHAG